MTNKTLIPAFQASVGDWKYYVCVMKYAEVANQVHFAYELGGNAELSEMIQRGITDRTREIREYLLKNKHRFLGALIVAVHGGDPSYQAFELDFDEDSPLHGTDRTFGILELHGSQQYFALDGQHRLRAIKDAIKKNPELGEEEIPVLLVAHYETEEGKERTRRLFTNINRNAKTTTTAENIALDEDDGFAIIARRIVNDHDLLGEEGVVRVYTRRGTEGDIRLAGKSVPKTDPKAWTTLHQLYDVLTRLGYDLSEGFHDVRRRPTDEELEEAYDLLTQRLEELLGACGNLKGKLRGTPNARDLRAPKEDEGRGHPLMRPVVQEVVADVIRVLCSGGQLTWEEALERLSKLPWRIENPPWIAVFNVDGNKMITAKENKELLQQLLLVHLAPQSKQAIARARTEFKSVRQFRYPLSQEDLEKGLED